MFPRTLLFFLLAALLPLIPAAGAQAPGELQTQIEKNNGEIEKLRQEIIQLQNDLNANNAQKQTLQTAVKSIDLNIQKLTKSISLTQAKIQQKDKEIAMLSGDISNTAGGIISTRAQVAGSLRELQMVDTQPMALTLLAGGSLSSM